MGEIVKFPKTNPRVEVGVLSESISVEAAIEGMKTAKLAMFADAIVDDVFRTVSILRLDETVDDPKQVTSHDTIMLKEAIIAAMSRIIGIEHPLHKIEEDQLVLSEFTQDIEGLDIPFLKYRFKDEDETKDRIDLSDALD